jgi:hypothetical protein
MPWVVGIQNAYHLQETFHPQSIMSTPPPVPPTSGAEIPEGSAGADQGVRGLQISSEFFSSDEDMGTKSPGQGRL